MVLAIVAGSAVLPVLAGTQQQKEADLHRYAVELASSLMEEVLARPFSDPAISDGAIGPSATETSRKAFRTIDAFHRYSESGDMLRGFDGTALPVDPDIKMWRDVNIERVTYPWQRSGTTDNLLLVRVTVYRNNDAIVTLSRLVSWEGV